MSVWSYGSFMMRADLFQLSPAFWNKILVLGSLAMPVAFLYFVLTFLRLNQYDHWLSWGLLSFLVLAIVNLLGYTMNEVSIVDDVLYYELGPAAPLMALNGYFFIGLSMWILIKQYRQSSDQIVRNRIRYPLLGLGIIAVASLTNFTPLGIYPVDISANLFSALILSYAIVRYDLLEMDFVMRKGAALATLTAAMAITYLFPVIVTALIFRHRVFDLGSMTIFFYLVLVIAISFTVLPLYERFKSRIDRLYFRERYDAYEMVQQLSQQTAAMLDLHELGDMLIERVADTLHTATISLLLKDTSSGEFQIVTSRGLSQTADPPAWRLDHPVSRWLADRGEILSADDLNTVPQLRGLWQQDIEIIQYLDAQLFVPLRTKGDLVGMLVLGPKRSEDVYSTADETLLSTLANQIAVAIENARLYAELQERAEQLEQRTAELEDSLRQLRDTQVQLIQSAKLASLGTLTAGIAHELNNPLSGIKLYAQSLLRAHQYGRLTDVQLQAGLEDIDALVDKSAHIIRHFRDFSRQSSGEYRQLHVNQPLQDAVKMISEQLRLNNIKLYLELDEELPLIHGNANQLEQVFLNLISNAHDAVKASEVKAITLCTAAADDSVIVEVADSGEGIEQEHLDRIFDPFFTTKEVGLGTGIGLSISHKIVEEHGGQIEVKSESGRGTVFKLIFPASADSCQADVETEPVELHTL